MIFNTCIILALSVSRAILAHLNAAFIFPHILSKRNKLFAVPYLVHKIFCIDDISKFKLLVGIKTTWNNRAIVVYVHAYPKSVTARSDGRLTRNTFVS